MPDCNYFEELCSVSLDGELTRAQKRELDKHLAQCPMCSSYLEDLKLMRTAWGDIKEPLPQALHEKIMAGVRKEIEENQKPVLKARRNKYFPLVASTIAAAACVALVLSGAAGDLLGGLQADPPAQRSAAAEGSQAQKSVASGAQSFSAVSDEAPESSQFPAAESPVGSAPKESEEDSGQFSVSSAQEGAPGSSDTGSAAPSPFLQERMGIMTIEGENAAQTLLVTLPDNLKTHTFGFCYVAVGSGNAPALDKASLIEKDGESYYFRIENNMSSLEKLRMQLQEAGFETALRADISIAADENAADSLLVLRIES